MFSLAATMIHLSIRKYSNLCINSRGEICDKVDLQLSLNLYLQTDIVFGPSGLDLLLKLMVNKPENRLCAKEALQHAHFYENLNINIDMFPISVHISYIYLQLLFEIKKLKTLTFERKFFQDICLHVIFWFIQPVPFNERVSMWEIVIFITIKLLSKIVMVSGIELIQNPIIPVLIMDERKYQRMLNYFYLQYLSIDFQKFINYTIYFNDPIFLLN